MHRLSWTMQVFAAAHLNGPLTSAILLVGNNVATRDVCIPQRPIHLPPSLKCFQKARWGLLLPGRTLFERKGWAVTCRVASCLVLGSDNKQTRVMLFEGGIIEANGPFPWMSMVALGGQGCQVTRSAETCNLPYFARFAVKR